MAGPQLSIPMSGGFVMVRHKVELNDLGQANPMTGVCRNPDQGSFMIHTHSHLRRTATRGHRVA
jgi:hypothetical protein